jgi:hypothetical protein
MSERSQTIVVWWALALTAIYGLTLGFLLHMIPPPDPVLSADQVAAWYADRHTEIRVGAVIAGWTSAFMLPLAAVIAIQMARQERGGKIWSVLTIAGGAMMSIFLVLPPLFWGVAAFTPGRNPEITTTMHELGMLTLTTTDQYYIFMWVAIVVICFLPTNVRHSPFPRWFGYLTAWIGIMFEAGAIAFLPRTGAFAWNGLFVFWSPLTLFGVWIVAQSVLLLKALKKQRLEAEAEAGQALAVVPS